MPPAIATYDDAVAYLLGRVDFERRPATSHECFRLDRTRRLLACLGNPQERIPAVHVAGTKGKGSTSAMIAAALTACGLRTGLFTSPHLERVEERFRIDGAMPSPAELVSLVAELAVVLDSAWPDEPRPTFFELLTAAAWMHFERRSVDVVVLEVGLGGRLDATNVCRPEVTVITNVSRDHTAILGEHPAQIAAEKAGIVKPGVPCVSGVDDPDARAVVVARCEESDVSLWELGRDVHVTPTANGAAADLLGVPTCLRVATPRREWPAVRVPLVGEHQARNAGLAVAVLDRLAERGWAIDPERATAGIAATSLPLRIETLGREPLIVCDAAHNEASIRALVATIGKWPCRGRRVAVFGTSRDKDHEALLAALLPAFDEVVLTRYVGNPRGTDVATLAEAVERTGRVARVTAIPREAWESVLASVTPADLVCITGSFFLAAEMRTIIRSASVAPVLAAEAQTT